MFQLQVSSNDVTNGNIAVSWCLDAQMLKKLSDNKVDDPQVVIVVSPVEGYHSHKEYRKVVPLKDLMTYVEFKASGLNKIWGFVSVNMPKDVRSINLSKNGGDYRTDILTDDGTNYYQLAYHPTNYSNDQYSVPIEVNVPAGAFAKEPPKWEKIWVNHWFRSKPQDQCDYRRRRLLAYTVQPLVMLLDIVVVRTMFLLLPTLWLSRGMTLQTHLHPLRNGVSEIPDLFKGGSWVIPHLPEDNDKSGVNLTFSYLFRKFWKMPLMPAVFLPLWFFHHFHMLGWVLAIVVAVIAVVCLVLFCATGGATWVFESIHKWLTEKPAVSPWYLEHDEIEAIVCTPERKAFTSVRSLPAKHRTIYLRFQDLKAKVCRPFSV
jgi:hypothetical protein